MENGEWRMEMRPTDGLSLNLSHHLMHATCHMAPMEAWRHGGMDLSTAVQFGDKGLAYFIASYHPNPTRRTMG